MLQEEKQDGRHRLHDDLLVPADVKCHLRGLHDVGGGLRGEDVHQDVEGVVAGARGGCGRQQDLQEGDHVLGEVGEEDAVQGLRWRVRPLWGRWRRGLGGSGRVGSSGRDPLGVQGGLLGDVDVGQRHVDVVVEDPDALPDGLGESREVPVVISNLVRPGPHYYLCLEAAELALAGLHKRLDVLLPGLGPELQHLHRPQVRGVHLTRQGRQPAPVLSRHRGGGRGGGSGRAGVVAGRLPARVKGRRGQHQGSGGLEVGVHRLESGRHARFPLQHLQRLRATQRGEDALPYKEEDLLHGVVGHGPAAEAQQHVEEHGGQGLVPHDGTGQLLDEEGARLAPLGRVVPLLARGRLHDGVEEAEARAQVVVVGDGDVGLARLVHAPPLLHLQRQQLHGSLEGAHLEQQ